MALPSARPATVVIMKCRNIDFSSVIQATGRKNSVVTCKLSKEEKLLLEKIRLATGLLTYSDVVRHAVAEKAARLKHGEVE